MHARLPTERVVSSLARRRRVLTVGLAALAAPLIISACGASCYSQAGDAAASCESRIAKQQEERWRPPGR